MGINVVHTALRICFFVVLMTAMAFWARPGPGLYGPREAGAAFPGLNGKIAFDSDRDGNFEIYVMNADGSGQANLTNHEAPDRGPAWSPDGSKIAFWSSRYAPSEVYVMNADGSGQTRLTNNAAWDIAPAWSPDGSKITFVSDRDGNDEIYVMNADGSGQTRLTNNGSADDDPVWSPDGSKIAFSSNRDVNYEIYVMNPDGSGQTPLTNNPAEDTGPDWSPNASKIAFSSNRDGNWEAYSMNAGGSGQTRLTTTGSSDADTGWSPDGSRIAFVSDRDGNYEIYKMNADGGGQTRLTNDAAEDAHPDWQSVAYALTKLTVDSTGDVGQYTSIAFDASGSPMISYYDNTNADLRFAWCDASTTGCSSVANWTKVTVDSAGSVGEWASIAVDANGDPMISYYDYTNTDLKFAWCDMSATGGCDQTGDWTRGTVDNSTNQGQSNSIAVDANGDPMISYYDQANTRLKFAWCDMSATGGCDQTMDWTRTLVDNEAEFTSIAVDANGDPMISYYDFAMQTLKFARCDMSATGGCDEFADWTKVTVDDHPSAAVGQYTSIAVDANGDPMISYYLSGAYQDLKFAWCDMSATGCDQTADWMKVTADGSLQVGEWSSIAVDGNGDPVISYYDFDQQDLKFATCDMSVTGCDASGEWTYETVDATGSVGQYTSIGIGPSGDPTISYYDETNGDLRVARVDAFPPAGTYYHTVECAAAHVVVDEDDKGDLVATGTAMVACTDPYFNDSGKECTDCTLESLDCQGILQGVPIGIEVLQRPGADPSSFTVCEQSPECGIDGDLSLEVSADEGGPWCGCYDGVRYASTGCVGTCTEVGGQFVLTCPGGLELCPCGTDLVSVTVTGPTSASFVPVVGGIAEWPGAEAGSGLAADSSSGSGFNYAALGGALAAVVAVLAGSVWFARRRWAR